MVAVLFKNKNKVPHPPIYEFPHTIKLIKYNGATNELLTNEVITIENVKVEQGTKTVTENFQQTLLTGNLVFVDSKHSKGFDEKDITIGSRVKFNDDTFTIKTVDVTNVSGEKYAIEVFMA